MPVDEKYVRIFLEEAEELLERLGERLLRLEQDPGDTEALRSAMRLAHTVKGSSRMVGLEAVSREAHALEDRLKAAATEGFTPDTVTELLQGVDRLRRELEGLSAPAGPPPSPAGTEPPSAPPPDEPARLKVATGRLDELQNLVDDLATQRTAILARMERFRRAFAHLGLLRWQDPDRPLEPEEVDALRGMARMVAGRGFSQFLDELGHLDRLVGELQNQVLALRMVPLGDLLEGFRRTARDLARELGKEVEIVVEGRLTEVDRSLLGAIQGPLSHLVRNAMDHGIESPEERERAGKPRRGRLTLRAYHRSNAVTIEVEDDGRGLDPREIRRKAVQKGLLSEEEARTLTDDEALYLLCRPGFSTRDRVSEVSGRGVGLDVVKLRVEKLKGSLVIQSEPGRWSRFRLLLPLSLTTLSALVVRAGDEPYALPALFVDRCESVPVRDLEARGRLWDAGDRVAPVIDLAAALGVERGRPAARVGVVRLRFRNRAMLLEVDRIEGERELVLKPLGPHLAGAPLVLGVSFLPSGEALPVLNVLDLYSRWAEWEANHREVAHAPRGPMRILVADDSVTTRHMLEQVVRASGYEPVLASNGAEAWELLRRERIDLVVTDLDMPELDGYGLIRRIRSTQTTASLPVVVLSNRTGDAERVQEAGANAFLPKDRFRQREFAAIVSELLGQGEGAR
ncbi:hybrid sensor histidine kinase/response regulator [Deferrisoma palaeochoriense]